MSEQFREFGDAESPLAPREVVTDASSAVVGERSKRRPSVSLSLVTGSTSCVETCGGETFVLPDSLWLTAGGPCERHSATACDHANDRSVIAPVQRRRSGAR